MANVSNRRPSLGAARRLFGISHTTTRYVAARRCSVCVLALLGAAFTAERAWADPISFEFPLRITRIVEETPGSLDQFFGTPPLVGQTMRTVFTPSTSEIPPDVHSGPDFGEYPLTGDWIFSWGVSTLTVANVPTFVDVFNGSFDNIVFIHNAEPGSPPDASGFLGFITLNFLGPGSSVGSDAFPNVQNLQPMNKRLVLDVIPPGSRTIGFELVARDPGTNPTPEPSSVLLFATAALMGAARQFRIRKHAD